MLKKEDYYSTTASCYNELHGEEQLRKLKIIKTFLDSNHLLKTGDTLLDVGCGTGLSAQVFKNKIIGVEPSELANQAPFLVERCHGEKLPFNNSSFDIVLCITALHNMVNPEQAAVEMRRVGRKLWIITILKKSSKAISLEKLLLKQFSHITILDDQHDKIFILESQKNKTCNPH